MIDIPGETLLGIAAAGEGRQGRVGAVRGRVPPAPPLAPQVGDVAAAVPPLPLLQMR